MIIENNVKHQCHNGCECSNKCINIYTNHDCSLIIEDNSYDPEYVLIFIIEHYTSSGKDFLKTIIRDDRNTLVAIPNSSDGLYSIYKLTLSIDDSLQYYYKDGKFYYNNLKPCDENITKEVSILEIVDINPKVSGIKRDFYQHFSTCNLRNCFIKICKELLNLKASACFPNPDATLTYKRDLVWMALNVIKYLVECKLYDEALRLLEEIITCNGLCPPSEKCNCGCNR